MIRKRFRAYKEDKLRNFVLLWVEEDIGNKGTPATEPFYFEPTLEELAHLKEEKMTTRPNKKDNNS